MEETDSLVSVEQGFKRGVGLRSTEEMRVELKRSKHALSLLFNQNRDVVVYHETSWSLESMTTGTAVWFSFSGRGFLCVFKAG